MLGSLSPIHWIIVLGVAAIVFGGRGKLSSIMGDAAKGIRAFKDGLKTEDEPHAAPAGQIAAQPTVVQPTVVQPGVMPQPAPPSASPTTVASIDGVERAREDARG